MHAEVQLISDVITVTEIVLRLDRIFLEGLELQTRLRDSNVMDFPVKVHQTVRSDGQTSSLK